MAGSQVLMVRLRTTDGGQFWRLQNTPEQRTTWRSVVAVSKSEVWIAGETNATPI